MRAFVLVSLISFLAPSQTSALADPYQNVFGNTLGLCDRSLAKDNRWPTTGYLRNNKCTFTQEDAGSHYVCVDLRKARVAQPDGTTVEDPTWTDFWTETGQAKSAEDAKNNWPKPGPWCICMWAFARMYGQHPDFSEMIDCSATNRWVVDDYNLNDANQCRALVAVCNKCNVSGPGASKDSTLTDKCTAALAKCGAGNSNGSMLMVSANQETPKTTGKDASPSVTSTQKATTQKAVATTKAAAAGTTKKLTTNTTKKSTTTTKKVAATTKTTTKATTKKVTTTKKNTTKKALRFV